MQQKLHVGLVNLPGAGVYAAMNSAGSTMLRLSITPQCRCGPVTRPVAPTAPRRSPGCSRAPTLASMALRCQFKLSRPPPWSSQTVPPLKK